jgi:hypothetical protein
MLGIFPQLPDGENLPGHSDVSTTMIYTDVLDRGGRTVAGPLGAI